VNGVTSAVPTPVNGVRIRRTPGLLAEGLSSFFHRRRGPNPGASCRRCRRRFVT